MDGFMFVNNTVESVAIQLKMDETQPKKKRHRPTPHQLEVLTTAFMVDSMPGAAQRQEIAQQLGMTPRAVQGTFTLS